MNVNLEARDYGCALILGRFAFFFLLLFAYTDDFFLKTKSGTMRTVGRYIITIQI